MFVTKLLLLCGVAAGAFYIGTDLAAATLLYPGYDYTAQQVSELSAIGAPSRPFWMAMGYPYTLLTLAFGAGIWRAAAGRTWLKLASVLVLLFGLNGFLWGYMAPMHMRGTEFTQTDDLHIAFAMAAVLLMIAFMSAGALALGRGFRVFSAATVGAMLVAGATVSTRIADIAANRPTPWMGLVERVSVYAPMIWMAALALLLIRQIGARPGRTEPRQSTASAA